MRDPVAVAFGRALREQRRARGMTQEVVAHEADVCRTFVSQIERGICRATITTLFKLSGALGVEPAALIDRTEDRLKNPRSDKGNGTSRHRAEVAPTTQ